MGKVTAAAMRVFKEAGYARLMIPVHTPGWAYAIGYMKALKGAVSRQ